GLDIFPYREDIVKACEYSIQNIKSLLKGLEKIDIPFVGKGSENHELY
ncbi:unnamed protein product, partial [marine sediment metagenome]